MYIRYISGGIPVMRCSIEVYTLQCYIYTRVMYSIALHDQFDDSLYVYINILYIYIYTYILNY